MLVISNCSINLPWNGGWNYFWWKMVCEQCSKANKVWNFRNLPYDARLLESVLLLEQKRCIYIFMCIYMCISLIFFIFLDSSSIDVYAKPILKNLQRGHTVGLEDGTANVSFSFLVKTVVSFANADWRERMSHNITDRLSWWPDWKLKKRRRRRRRRRAVEGKPGRTNGNLGEKRCHNVFGMFNLNGIDGRVCVCVCVYSRPFC